MLQDKAILGKALDKIIVWVYYSKESKKESPMITVRTQNSIWEYFEDMAGASELRVVSDDPSKARLYRGRLLNPIRHGERLEFLTECGQHISTSQIRCIVDCD
jgi:hypothetical protein